jgi:hypothetical protein
MTRGTLSLFAPCSLVFLRSVSLLRSASLLLDALSLRSVPSEPWGDADAGVGASEVPPPRVRALGEGGTKEGESCTESQEIGLRSLQGMRLLRSVSLRSVSLRSVSLRSVSLRCMLSEGMRSLTSARGSGFRGLGFGFAGLELRVPEVVFAYMGGVCNTVCRKWGRRSAGRLLGVGGRLIG